MGAMVLPIKTGKIEPILFNISQLSDMTECDYIIFTSKNAVNAFMWNIKQQGRDIRILGSTKIAAVGSKTAKEVERFGLICDVVAKGNTGADLAYELASQVDKLSRVFWINAKSGNSEIADILRNKCKVIEICGYECAKGNLPKRVFSIGPTCSEMLRRLGVENIIQAEKSNYESLIETVTRYSVNE